MLRKTTNLWKLWQRKALQKWMDLLSIVSAFWTKLKWAELQAGCNSLQNLLCFDWGKTVSKRFSEEMILWAPSDFTIQRTNCLDSETLWQGFVDAFVFVWQVFTPLALRFLHFIFPSPFGPLQAPLQTGPTPSLEGLALRFGHSKKRESHPRGGVL